MVNSLILALAGLADQAAEDYSQIGVFGAALIILILILVPAAASLGVSVFFKRDARRHPNHKMDAVDKILYGVVICGILYVWLFASSVVLMSL